MDHWPLKISTNTWSDAANVKLRDINDGDMDLNACIPWGLA